MDSGSLGMLIVGSISAIGLIQLIAWTVVVMKNPRVFPLTISHHTACNTCPEQTEQK
jgi:hypothetical protein